jgi:two-component system nitrate/nitrite response regulator NarL
MHERNPETALRSQGFSRHRRGGAHHREISPEPDLLNGSPNKEIACELDISDGTVKVRLKAILKKIGVQNRTQAAIWAMDHRVALGISTVQSAPLANGPRSDKTRDP